ncbi:MAG: RagB/SusD family nutrient uptake outer membrane protein [Prevotella sp.]|nr:RagB/SusD family nutrient uptake outer membrane protein [Prevotella sp.]
MKLLRNIVFCTFFGAAFTACQDLNIPPKNILSGSDIYNEGGITAYMSALYSHLPMEDFNMGDDGGRGGFFNWYCVKTTLGSTGEFANNECGNSMVYGDKGYWGDAYKNIRQCNVLINDLPNYESTLNPADVKAWIGEARFVRAYTYFALVKRYGGVPLLEKAQNLNDTLTIARSSHQECVDFILRDLDYAMQNMSGEKINGRANKWVAAAIKSRVALYAGSVARYGQNFNYTSATTGTQLCGLPENLANNYFQQAYDAAKFVDGGSYALVTGSDKRQACYDVFDKAASNTESILIREYDINNYVHSWDQCMAPSRMVSSYGGRYFVPLDWVELFDGLPIDPTTGFLKTTDANGDYVVYNSVHGIYDNAEPRLKASIMIPGETYKVKYELDMRTGLLVDCTPADKIKKTTKDDGKTTYNWNNGVNAFKVGNKVVAVRATRRPRDGQTYQETGIAICGFDGPSTSAENTCNTGIYGVKHLVRNLPTGETALHRSTQPWVDIRYAEVLLNRAEAAVELAQNGASNASDLYQDAFVCMNKVRDRAGANLLASPSQLADMEAPVNGIGLGRYSWIFAPTKGLQLIRVERYKELAIEHKLFWDIKRWFTADQQMRDFRWRMLASYLFLSTAVKDPDTGIPHGKYIFDSRVCDSYGGTHTFDSKYYYERIPEGERKINYLLEQNARY